MRLYSVTNMYLSDIQKGIQTAHIVSELSKIDKNADYKEWAENYKTIIVLNGGYSQNIQNISEIIGNSTLQGVAFTESEEALGGALTATGVVVPEKFYLLGQYAKQGLVNTVPVETDGSPVTEAYIAEVNPEAKLNEEDTEKLTEQLKDFGVYTTGDIVLINTLNNLRLA